MTVNPIDPTKPTITRDVITDLWPLYADGAASADTRALVEEFLRRDPDWAQAMQAARAAPLPPPDAKPDQETRMFNRIKSRQRLLRWMLMLAMIFTCQAFGRIIADTSWDVSPRAFIATAAVAGVFWIGFFIAVVRVRKVGI